MSRSDRWQMFRQATRDDPDHTELLSIHIRCQRDQTNRVAHELELALRDLAHTLETEDAISHYTGHGDHQRRRTRYLIGLANWRTRTTDD